MSKTKRKSNKKRLVDQEENVSPPWEAWFHIGKQQKFYVNKETNISIWEHPDSLKETGDVQKLGSSSRKRREPERKDVIEDNLMEIDLPPPPKRKSTESSESDERVKKRARKDFIKEEPENFQPALRTVDPDKILPRVSWNSQIRPLKRLPYRGCAIFDTCALIEYSEALTASTEKQILTVVPYAVLSELDGLKNNPKTHKCAIEVNTRLKELLQEKNIYLLVETSMEQKIQIEKFRPDENVKDDIILNCALRVKEEIMSIAPLLNLNERAVLLVTNDKVLSTKAMTHGIEIENVASFMQIINGNERPPQTKNEKKKCSASQEMYSQPILPHVPYEPPKNKKIAVDQIQEKRDLGAWNQDMKMSARGRDNGPPRESSESSNRVQLLTGRPLVSDRPSKNKKMAIEKIQKTREVKDWIQEMTKNAIGRASEATPKNSNSLNITPTRSRPTIPLEDEVIPTLTNTVKPKPIYTPQLTYQSRNTVKSTQPTRPRPMMPCSLSDDDDDVPISAGDEMDCT